MTGTYAHLTIELDVFSGVYDGLILAEVEFPTVEEAEAFVPPEWSPRTSPCPANTRTAGSAAGR